jgi:hypothetical protein
MGSMFLWNIGICLQVHVALLPRRPTLTVWYLFYESCCKAGGDKHCYCSAVKNYQVGNDLFCGHIWNSFSMLFYFICKLWIFYWVKRSGKGKVVLKHCFAICVCLVKHCFVQVYGGVGIYLHTVLTAMLNERRWKCWTFVYVSCLFCTVCSQIL